MNSFVLKGNICYSEGPERTLLFPDSYIVCENGLCAGIFQKLPERYAALPLTDHGKRIIIPGLIDLHLHAPQFAFRGLGMDLELMDWLETYTFPEESKYADLAYAEKAYSLFARHMHRSATTRASVFASIHTPATELLMDKMEESGLISYVGKVNMDRNCPEYYCEKNAEASLEATEQWICAVRDKYRSTRPIITPRFVPTCTDELMRGLRRLVEKYDLPVQSHLSENLGEIALVRELCPDTAFYGEAYDRFGLFGGDHPCIMAHCVHTNEAELELIRKNGVYIAHSPLSNCNIASGISPTTKYIANGMNVGLASDVAGGETENLFTSLAAAIRVSKLRWRLLDQSVTPMSVDQAFYIATKGGGSFFGKVGSFEEGYEFDALVLDDTGLDHPMELTLRQRLDRCLYLADDRDIKSKFVRGEKLF